MQLNGREIEYIGNRTWKVDGSRATLAAFGSHDIKIAATGEVVALSQEDAAALEAEFRAPRQVAVATKPAAKVTEGNLAYHMYNPNGRLFG